MVTGLAMLPMEETPDRPPQLLPLPLPLALQPRLVQQQQQQRDLRNKLKQVSPRTLELTITITALTTTIILTLLVYQWPIKELIRVSSSCNSMHDGSSAAVRTPLL